MTLEEYGISKEDAVSFLQKYENSNKKLLPQEALSVLENQNALRYFKFNIDKYCELHRVIIGDIEDATELIAFVKNENTFHKVIRDKEDFHNNFLEIVMPTLLDACSKFHENETVFQEISGLVQKCIFSSKEFICYLTDLFEKRKCSEKHTHCKELLKFCASSQSRTLTFKTCFYSFCKANRSFDQIYKMLIIFTEIAGFDLKEEFSFNKVKYQVCEPTLNGAVEILNDLLDIIIKFKIDLDHKINDVTFSDFLKNILKSVMALSQVPNASCLEIFLKVIEINPLIIESIISETLVYVMLSDNSNYKLQYQELMLKIFEVFNKLHRIQNLISKMIPTIKAGLENRTLNETVYNFKGFTDIKSPPNSYNVNDLLPKDILDYFTNCITNLASWQIINLFKTLLFHLKNAVGELAENTYVEILGNLTCWLLMSVRMAEHTVAEVTVAKFVDGLEELKVILGNFGTSLLQREHDHVLMRAFLNICFYWAEIYVTLEYYSNGRIKMTKSNDGNLTYLHPYLSKKEWCLISERINNFGEKPCKEIMQKLQIQKLKACTIFEENVEDILSSIVRSLSSDFDSESLEIFTDKFFVNQVLNKFPTGVIVSLSEAIVNNLIDKNIKILPHIYDSQLLTNGILCVVFTKINKIMRQKRKHDDVSMRKPWCSKVVSVLPPELFLNNNIEQFLETIVEILISGNQEEKVELNLQESKILLYLETLTNVSLMFCSEINQKLVILLLMALHRDLRSSNCIAKCETLILSILQCSKFTLMDIFDPPVLLGIMFDHFNNRQDLFVQIAQNTFKSESSIIGFESAVTYIKDNLKKDQCLMFAVNLLHILLKTKKIKNFANSKTLAMKYKLDLCRRLVKMISKSSPQERFVEAYALTLKTCLLTDEKESLSRLTAYLPNYIEFCISNPNMKGCLVLFITILHNKMLLTELEDDLILRIWNSARTITITSDNLEDYSQLVMLIASSIPNDQFPNIFQNLSNFSQHSKTWSCILSTNLNSHKTNILRGQLEFLLESILPPREDIFEQVIQFEVSIIQANHVPLTASIIDFILLSVSCSSIHSFNLSVSLLENLLKHRKPLIMDRLPPFLLQYRVLLKELCAKSNSNVPLPSHEIQQIADSAHKLEKLTKSLVDCTKDMARIAMYLVADILVEYELHTIYPNVKKHLDNCIYSLISLCDQHAVQYLMRVLSNASTEIFKVMYENYKKYYRFTGKV